MVRGRPSALGTTERVIPQMYVSARFRRKGECTCYIPQPSSGASPAQSPNWIQALGRPRWRPPGDHVFLREPHGGRGGDLNDALRHTGV